MLCAQLFKCPKWSPFGNWLFPSLFSLRVLDVRSSAKRLQQLVTGLELTADRGSAWGQLVSGSTAATATSTHTHTPLPSHIQISPMHHPHSLSPPLSLPSLRGPELSGRGALGVKGVQADGQDLACRMLTIRQKTLIGFNWKSIMGLIASSPCCHPRMAPVIWGLHLVADHAVKYRTDGLITGAFMMRKIALKIQWAEPSRAGCCWEKWRGGPEGQGNKSNTSQTHQKIIIVPSWPSVTDSDNDDPRFFFMKRGLFLQSAQLII